MMPWHSKCAANSPQVHFLSSSTAQKPKNASMANLPAALGTDSGSESEARALKR